MTAHLTFTGGGLLLPARTPYDRQILTEHVLDRARHSMQVRVVIGRKTWIVERPNAQRSSVCSRCAQPLTSAVLHLSSDAVIYCAWCALR
jgi:hypothetical protein